MKLALKILLCVFLCSAVIAGAGQPKKIAVVSGGSIHYWGDHENELMGELVSDMLKEALDAGAEIIMLDNMSVEDMKEAVKLVSGKAETECSGNVTKENVERLVDIGVDYISSGALTHSSPILDLSLKNLHAI